MGNVCAKEQTDPEAFQNKPQLHSSILSNSEMDKVQEIKEFLTLTSENTDSFFVTEHYCPTDSSQPLKPQQKSIEDFTIIRALGKGSFGHVLMVKDKAKNKFFAMKIIAKEKIKSEQDKIHTLSERYILEAMNHTFLVRLHYAFQTRKKLYLLVDLMPGGELFYLLRRNKRFPENVAKFYGAEILLALRYIHKRNIIYRDLKPENILLDKEGHIKLTDFGLSKVCYSQNEIAYSVCGTPEYIAPEVIKGKGYSQMADWFSFGSLLFDMLTGRPPFYSKNKHEMLKNIATKPVPIPESLSPQAKSILKALFKFNPKERLGSQKDAADIMQHEFFKDIDFQQLESRNIKPPITFRESEINEKGFDENLGEFGNSVFDEHSLKGTLGYDGFTYFKADVLSPMKEGGEGGELLKELQI